MTAPSKITPPAGRTWTEAARLARGLVGLPSLLYAAPNIPRGTGRTVMVVPGFLTGDGSTLALRTFLNRIGYRAIGWGLGRNRGDVPALVPRLAERIHAASAEAPVELIGWSLGGVLAREAARSAPDRVRRIVTMGTPVVGGPKYTLAADHYRRRGIDLDDLEREVAEANQEPLPVPITAIYSRNDGVVAWQACIDDNPHNQVEYIELGVGHAELGFSARVYRTIADALAEGAHSTTMR